MGSTINIAVYLNEKDTKKYHSLSGEKQKALRKIGRVAFREQLEK